jgi:hypothetical protein
MGYNTEQTEWPTFEINTAVKHLIDRFFWHLDQQDPSVGNVLADEIFGKTGEAEFGGHTFTGTEGKSTPSFSLSSLCRRLNLVPEIRRSRDNAWKLITKRRHKVLKVFAADLDGSDLLFIGHVAMDLHNGKSVAGEFTGRLRIENATSSEPKLLLYQIWAVGLEPWFDIVTDTSKLNLCYHRTLHQWLRHFRESKRERPRCCDRTEWVNLIVESRIHGFSLYYYQPQSVQRFSVMALTRYRVKYRQYHMLHLQRMSFRAHA